MRHEYGQDVTEPEPPMKPATDTEPLAQLNELSFYGLAGAPTSPRDLLRECRDGESMGFGSVLDRKSVV